MGREREGERERTVASVVDVQRISFLQARLRRLVSASLHMRPLPLPLPLLNALLQREE